jgi:hypothetical protein
MDGGFKMVCMTARFGDGDGDGDDAGTLAFV